MLSKAFVQVASDFLEKHALGMQLWGLYLHRQGRSMDSAEIEPAQQIDSYHPRVGEKVCNDAALFEHAVGHFTYLEAC